MNASTLWSQFVAAAQNGGTVVILAKATLVFTAALVLLSLARRGSASLRHRIASMTFAVALLLPLAAAVTPARVVTVSVDAPARVATAAQTHAQPNPIANRSEERATTPALNPIGVATRVYIGGVIFFLLSLAVAVLRLHRLRAGADVYVAGTRLANELAAEEGTRGGIEVFISSRIAVPMTFGWRHPAILLPAEVSEWDTTAVRRALRHELEHIVRRDWLTQIVSRVGCAVYWPHPQVWMLWSRLRLEAERACDDAVIRNVAPDAEPYAEQLVELARRIAGHGSVPALAMATRSNLGRRVESILDRSRGRGRISRWASAIVGVIAGTLLLAIAPLQLIALPTAGANGVDSGAVASDPDNDPLDYALLKVASAGDAVALRSLLARGAKPDAVFRGDGTALIEAARGGHLEAMSVLISAGADPNRGVRGDGNPLIAAAVHGNVNAVSFLLDHGADIDRGIPSDGNALIMAAGAGELEVVRLLVGRGASVEAVVPGDENPLIHACEGGAPEVVQYLISKGANVNARVWADFGDGEKTRGEWRTPLVMARRNHHDDIVRILQRAGAKE
jgi:beta-lactamase regulating signal transducer with metallopeptidase domain/ankyrin repeat protein